MSPTDDMSSTTGSSSTEYREGNESKDEPEKSSKDDHKMVAKRQAEDFEDSSPGQDMKNAKVTKTAVGSTANEATKKAVTRKKRAPAKKSAVNNKKRAPSVWLDGAGGYDAANGEYVQKAPGIFVRKGGPVLLSEELGSARFTMNGDATGDWHILCDPLYEPWCDYTFAVWKCRGNLAVPPATGWESLISNENVDDYAVQIVPTSNPTVRYK